MGILRVGLAFILSIQLSYAFHVVLDPGHGGHDLGTFYRTSKEHYFEKNITLQIAKKLSHQLKAHGILTTLTRVGDQDVSLADRTALANRVHADLFISLHLNATQAYQSNYPFGVETFILNYTTDASSKRLAQIENSLFPQNFDKDLRTPEQTDVALILKDLKLDSNLHDSQKLACLVQKALIQGSHKNRNRGVKQALFHVLLGADMPSILVELGFLSHPQDRALLTSHPSQWVMTRYLKQAILDYKKLKHQRIWRNHDWRKKCKPWLQ